MQTNVSAVTGFQQNRAGSGALYRRDHLRRQQFTGTARQYQDSHASLSRGAVSLPVGAPVPPCSEELIRTLINKPMAPKPATAAAATGN
jgi:hypothetical protein